MATNTIRVHRNTEPGAPRLAHHVLPCRVGHDTRRRQHLVWLGPIFIRWVR